VTGAGWVVLLGVALLVSTLTVFESIKRGPPRG
jgi:hypothetical protein